MPVPFDITLGGSPVEHIERLCLSEAAFEHAECRLRIPVSPSEYNWLKTLKQQIGVALVVKDGQGKMVFSGLITSLSFMDIYVEAVAHSNSWKLDQVVRTRTYLNMSCAAIVKQVFADHGVQVEQAGNLPAGVFVSKTQYNETDYHFALRLATSHGITIFNVADKTILAVPPYSGNSGTIRVEQIDHSRVEISARLCPFARAHQSHNYLVQRDHTTKITAEPQPPNQDVHEAALDASKRLGGQASLSYGLEFRQKGQLEDYSKAVAEYRIAQMVTVAAYVTEAALGVSMLASFDEKSAAVGDRAPILKGKYVVSRRGLDYGVGDGTATNRLWMNNAAYRLPPPAVSLSFDLTTLENALVESVDDDKALGRVKVQLPWQKKNEAIYARVPHRTGGADHGHLVLPHKGDEVLVAFEQGDPDKPVVVGAAYHEEAKPQAYQQPEKEWFLGYTKDGTLIKIDDRDGKQMNILLCVGDQTGASPTAQIKIDKANKDILIKSDNTVHVMAAKQVFVEGTNLVDIKSAKEVVVTGTQKVDIKSSQEVSVTGTQAVKIASSTKVEINGGALLELKAVQVKIDAQAQMQLQAPMILIN